MSITTRRVKTCIHCCVEKPMEAFGLCKRSKDGRRAKCKECRNEIERLTVDREAQRARYHRDKAKHKPMRTAYNKANADHRKAKTKLWRELNPEKLKSLKKRYAVGRVDRTQDGYVRSLLASSSTVLKPADIPQALVELKKEHLRLCRELRKEDHEDHEDR